MFLNPKKKSNFNSNCSNLLCRYEKPSGTSQKSILLPKIVLTFHCLNKFLYVVISNILKILSLHPRISKVFLDHKNIFFSQQVRTILVTKYTFSFPSLFFLLTFMEKLCCAWAHKIPLPYFDQHGAPSALQFTYSCTYKI